MKKLAKMMAVFAAMMMALSFAGCSDDDDGPAVVAEYQVNDGVDSVTITFYDDDTFTASMDELGIVGKGTYTGNAKKEGVAAMTHVMDGNGSLQEIPDGGVKIPFTVENEKLIFDFSIQGI